MRYDEDPVTGAQVPCGETAADQTLLHSLIRAHLPVDWRPLWTLRGDSAGWQWRFRIGLVPAPGEAITGIIAVQRETLEPATCLDGAAFPLCFWIEIPPSVPEFAALRVHWEMPANALTHAQENFLPHLPVLRAAKATPEQRAPEADRW